MLKFENTANVGDTIRAYDFQPMPDRPDTYLIGEVIEKGQIWAKPDPDYPREIYMCDGYTVRVTDASDEDWHRIGSIVYVPFEMSLTDFDNRVEVI